MAGDRVTTDLLAMPFSMGRNLLCIFSKKHVDNPPELKSQKTRHNRNVMKTMGKMFSEGGKESLSHCFPACPDIVTYTQFCPHHPPITPPLPPHYPPITPDSSTEFCSHFDEPPPYPFPTISLPLSLDPFHNSPPPPLPPLA